MTSLINELNKEFELQQFVSIKNLELGKKFKIESFSKCTTVWGEKVVIHVDEFKTVLPARFVEKFTPEVLKELNESIKQGKKIFFANKGAVGQSSNIEFYEE